MPNWCDCEVTIKGRPTVLKGLVDKVCSADETSGQLILDTNKIIPYPEEYRIPDEAHEKWFNAHYNQEKHTLEGNLDEAPKDGFNNGGYDWCIKHWGTKWGICHCELLASELDGKVGTLKYNFDTAWSPPLPLMKALSEMFPDVTVSISYWECGAGFRGRIRYRKGECISKMRADYKGNRGG